MDPNAPMPQPPAQPQPAPVYPGIIPGAIAIGGAVVDKTATMTAEHLVRLMFLVLIVATVGATGFLLWRSVEQSHDSLAFVIRSYEAEKERDREAGSREREKERTSISVERDKERAFYTSEREKDRTERDRDRQVMVSFAMELQDVRKALKGAGFEEVAHTPAKAPAPRRKPTSQ